MLILKNTKKKKVIFLIWKKDLTEYKSKNKKETDKGNGIYSDVNVNSNND